jgi:hypothetical protein
MRFKAWFLMESTSSIISMGYPEIIAKILYEKFGRFAPIIAKWLPESKFNVEVPKNWWFQIFSDYRRTPSLYDLTRLYTAADNPEAYKKVLIDIGISSRFDDGDDLEEEKKLLRARIEPTFFEDYFFNNSIIKDIQSGVLKDIGPYKKLSFEEAQHKYDAKRIFNDATPIKTYSNGFKWINVGRRCSLIGHQMRNCGSAGLMSLESEAVMIVLFGPENTPHVVVTYSPKEKRISGDEGGASTEVKPQYHEYILDLTQILGAKFDANKSKSTFLKVKYLLQGKATEFQEIKLGEDKFFMFNMEGKVYYTDGYLVVSKEDVEKVQEAIKQGQVTLDNKMDNIIQSVFNYRNKPTLAHIGVKYALINQL